MTVTLRFWGVRGSLPSPGPATVRYGGNTPCVTLAAGGDHLVVLDAGTGIRDLGQRLYHDGGPRRVTLLLTHTHWDHIQGLPFFRPLYEPEWQVRIVGPEHPGVGLARVLDRLTRWENFPIPASRWVGLAEITGMAAGPLEVGDWTVQTFPACHAGPTLGYRLTRRGTSVAYLPDNELAGTGLHGTSPGWRRELVHFLSGTGTLIHDATNTDDEAGERAGWGHSSAREAVSLACGARCRRLVLFHHDPARDDAAMDRVLDEARGFAAGLATGLSVEAAMEGMTLRLDQEA
jgi:phosphoribosyl 1,2-cyclic phosphodiesterase